MMLEKWRQMSALERRKVAEDLARTAPRGFFDDYSDFKNLAIDKRRRQAVNNVLFYLES
jgi:hypothetical protein